MKFAPSGATKSVEAAIVDDAGGIVAQRTLTDRSARACVPLARAVGAWASLVLDAELARAKDDDGPSSLAPLAPAPSGSGPIVRLAHPAAPRDSADADGRDSSSTSAPHRSIELGVMTYIRNGMTPTGGFAGVSPFVTIEVSSGWVLRPSVAIGRSTSTIPTDAGGPRRSSDDAMSEMSHLGARADFCRRIPGNYIERRGIEADLCAGMETGLVISDDASAGNRSAGRFGLGPSANLRGELAFGIALELRGLVGANVVDASVYQEGPPPLVFAAAELGMSVRLP